MKQPFSPCARFLFGLLVALALVSASTGALIVDSPDNNASTFTIAREWFDGASAQTAPIVGRVELWNSNRDGVFPGAVVLIDGLPTNLLNVMRVAVLQAQNTGAVAVILRMPRGDRTFSLSC